MDTAEVQLRHISLFETLVAAWPQWFMEEDLAYLVRGKVRRTFRLVSYRVVSTKEEAWQKTIEDFAIAAMDRMRRAYFGNPWFWAVSWTPVFAAAAVELFPGIGTPAELRAVAADAAAAHFAALLANTAAHDSTAVRGLPGPAVIAMQLLHEPTLPTLPFLDVHDVVFVAEVNPRDWQHPPPRLQLPPGAAQLLQPTPGQLQPSALHQVPGTAADPWAAWGRRQQRRAASEPPRPVRGRPGLEPVRRTTIGGSSSSTTT